MTLPRRRGEAFCALLEHFPADRLPRHGGTATSVVVTVDLDAITRGAGVAGLSTGGTMTAAEVRRLACSANVLPAVLGGAGEILDLGRSRRLFSSAQRKALMIRDRRCRAEHCEIPAAWSEAHHAERPWRSGGRTDLTDGLLLCSFHHHRAHDPGRATSRLPNGDVRYRRRGGFVTLAGARSSTTRTRAPFLKQRSAVAYAAGHGAADDQRRRHARGIGPPHHRRPSLTG
jgi:hypothetical protein